MSDDIEVTFQLLMEWVQRRLAITESVKRWILVREAWEADTLKPIKEYLIRMGFAMEDVNQMRLSTKDEQTRAARVLVCSRLTKIHRVKIRAYKRLTVLLTYLCGISMYLGFRVGSPEVALVKLLKEIRDSQLILGYLARTAKGNMFFLEQLGDFDLLTKDSEGLIKSVIVNALDSEMVYKSIETGKTVYLYVPSYVDLNLLNPDNIEEVVKGANAVLVEPELEDIVEVTKEFFKVIREKEAMSTRVEEEAENP